MSDDVFPERRKEKRRGAADRRDPSKQTRRKRQRRGGIFLARTGEITIVEVERRVAGDRRRDEPRRGAERRTNPDRRKETPEGDSGG